MPPKLVCINIYCFGGEGMIVFQDIIVAYEKMKGIVHMTPLDYSSTFSELSQNEVYLKLENLQKTGSFKVRGSYNKMVSLEKGDLENGVVAEHLLEIMRKESRILVICLVFLVRL